jgi:hypothetical protein
MRMPAKTGRIFQRATLAIIAAGICHCAWAAETACLDAMEYQRLAKRYDDLTAQFDLPPIAQVFLDVSNETQDLKEQVTACRKDHSASERQGCASLAKQHDAMKVRQEAAYDRFNAALDMQEYLYSLKLRLLQPKCGK